MGVVNASGLPSPVPPGFAANWPPKPHLTARIPRILAFKSDGKRNSNFLTYQEPVAASADIVKEPRGVSKRSEKKTKKPVKAVSIDEAQVCSLDYSAVAATLESIYKQSPGEVQSSETEGQLQGRSSGVGNKDGGSGDESGASSRAIRRVRSKARFNLDKGIAKKKDASDTAIARKGTGGREDEAGEISRLLGEYQGSMSTVDINWNTMRMPPVLSSADHNWLFSLMQPMKVILGTKESFSDQLSREPSDEELAMAMGMHWTELQKQLEIGYAARHKLMMHNLRLVLFVVNKHYRKLATGSMFCELCQEGLQGLLMSIDRFDPKRGSRLSTYALFWIRHRISRYLARSNPTPIPPGYESARRSIQKATFLLRFELERMPTDEEIIKRTGLSEEKYYDVISALKKKVWSLESWNSQTGESYEIEIPYEDDTDKQMQLTHLKLALDNVLDSLKPKENMVIRQRFGLDGKGNRSLAEIARNLNISREMVRKYEVKALMKLRHPTRLSYLSEKMSW